MHVYLLNLHSFLSRSTFRMSQSHPTRPAGPFLLRVGPMQKFYRWSAVLQSKQKEYLRLRAAVSGDSETSGTRKKGSSCSESPNLERGIQIPISVRESLCDCGRHRRISTVDLPCCSESPGTLGPRLVR
jgi:hypothetical protein